MTRRTLFMSALRRRLASCALLMTALHVALVFAVPVSACCGDFRLKAETTREATKEVECCPAGAHAPGQCPLHRPASAHKQQKDECRMRCDASHDGLFLIAAIGVLPRPAESAVVFTHTPLEARGIFAPASRPSVPDAPPPRLL